MPPSVIVPRDSFLPFLVLFHLLFLFFFFPLSFFIVCTRHRATTRHAFVLWLKKGEAKTSPNVCGTRPFSQRRIVIARRCARYKISTAAASGKKRRLKHETERSPSFEIILRGRLSSTCLDPYLFLSYSLGPVHPSAVSQFRDVRKYILGCAKYTCAQ